MLNIAIDFDGVLNTYTGWNGKYDLYEPRKGADEFLKQLSEKFEVIIFTTREVNSVSRWLDEYDLGDYVTEITNFKPRAVMYIDDRGINFDGDYDKILNLVDNFKTHWELENGE